MLRDVACVPAEAGEHIRRHGELEHEAGEVEPRRRRGDAAIVHGLPAPVKDGQVEPREVVHVCRNRIRLRGSQASFDQLTEANDLQRRAFQLLELNPNRM